MEVGQRFVKAKSRLREPRRRYYVRRNRQHREDGKSRRRIVGMVERVSRLRNDRDGIGNEGVRRTAIRGLESGVGMADGFATAGLSGRRTAVVYRRACERWLEYAQQACQQQ